MMNQLVLFDYWLLLVLRAAFGDEARRWGSDVSFEHEVQYDVDGWPSYWHDLSVERWDRGGCGDEGEEATERCEADLFIRGRGQRRGWASEVDEEAERAAATTRDFKEATARSKAAKDLRESAEAAEREAPGLLRVPVWWGSRGLGGPPMLYGSKPSFGGTFEAVML